MRRWRLKAVDSITVLTIVAIHTGDVIFDMIIINTLYLAKEWDLLALAIVFVVGPALLSAVASKTSDPSEVCMRLCPRRSHVSPYYVELAPPLPPHSGRGEESGQESLGCLLPLTTPASGYHAHAC